MDIAATHGSGAGVSLALGEPAGGFAPVVPLASMYNVHPEEIQIADLDGDGLNDVALVHGGWNAASFYLQATDGSFGEFGLGNLLYCDVVQPRRLHGRRRVIRWLP